MKLSSNREKFTQLFTMIGLILLFVVSVYLLGLDIPKFLSRFENLGDMISNFLGLKLEALPEIMYQLLISIALAICPLFIGGVISVILSFLAANNIAFSKTLSIIIKSVVSIIRAIPFLVLILMVAASLGFGYKAGVVGLIFLTVGYLTKSFTATIEEQDDAIIETMRATGASWLQVVTEGLLPNVINLFLSWMSIILEANIAASISLGIVGAGGIGMLLNTAIRQYDFPMISTIILVIFLSMFFFEMGSNQVKKRLRADE